VAVAVGTVDQGDGDDVMGKHLPMIFATLLDVDDDDFMEPEGELG
jgi:hypothetical protein